MDTALKHFEAVAFQEVGKPDDLTGQAREVYIFRWTIGHDRDSES